jgi:3-hydroxyisobutyrate dehydrogenase
MNTAFIGLGVMGYSMAGHLLHSVSLSGYKLTVYNRNAERAGQWQRQFGGAVADTPRGAAAGADYVMLCVGNDDDVRDVVYGNNGVLAAMEPGAVLVDHTTTSATLAEELAARCAEQGVGFLDAPVSGGESGAHAGSLSIMVGGDEELFAGALPVLQSYGKNITLLGPAGSGQRCKMVNQICIAGMLQGLAEGINFASATGLDVEKVVSLLRAGAAQSWQLDNRALTMAKGEFDFGFALDWMRKDLAICLEQAKQLGVELPVAKLVDGYYGELQQRGLGRSDTSALIVRLRSDAVDP